MRIGSDEEQEVECILLPSCGVANAEDLRDFHSNHFSSATRLVQLRPSETNSRAGYFAGCLLPIPDGLDRGSNCQRGCSSGHFGATSFNSNAGSAARRTKLFPP